MSFQIPFHTGLEWALNGRGRHSTTVNALPTLKIRWRLIDGGQRFFIYKKLSVLHNRDYRLCHAHNGILQIFFFHFFSYLIIPEINTASLTFDLSSMIIVLQIFVFQSLISCPYCSLFIFVFSTVTFRVLVV